MKPTVYIETSIVSYLTARPSRDLVRKAHQAVTRRWWAEQRSAYSLVTSQVVIEEAAAGDRAAADDRLAALSRVSLLGVTPTVELVTRRLLDDGALPSKARVDALHLAIAAVHGIRYLLTWNCKHLANAMLRDKIEMSFEDAGLDPPVICTPLELERD